MTMVPRLLALWLLAAPAAATLFYPEGHFDRVDKVADYEGFQQYIQETIGQGKTAPSWNDVTRLFAGNNDVAFADINLKDAPSLRRNELQPGAGGWPTIRYFNEKTGANGGAYQKLTPLPMCKELGDRMRMIDYVEEYGNTVLCGLDGTNCNEKELAYLSKWKSKSLQECQDQITRLQEMTSQSLNDEIIEWAWRRLRILSRLVAATATEAEL